jgi:hypothetical protein
MCVRRGKEKRIRGKCEIKKSVKEKKKEENTTPSEKHSCHTHLHVCRSGLSPS